MVSRLKAAAAVAIVCGCAASHASAQSLTTLFATNNSGSAGGIVFFDANITNPIIIDALDVNTATLGNIGLTVYTIPGTYVGNTGNMAAWTQVSTGSGTGMGNNIPSPVTLDTPFQLNAGNYGIAIVGAAPGFTSFSHAYTNGTGSNQFYSNSDLSLTLGAAGNTPFPPSIFSPRVWNGTIYYDPANPNAIGACCMSDGTCDFITLANCQAANGTFRGENVTCAQANCPQPGACCMNDGTCDFILESACDAAGGTWTSAGTTCAQANCPQPEACCFFDGSCTLLVPAECQGQGGTPQGTGSVCGTCPSIPGVFYTNCTLATGATTLSGAAAPPGAEWSEVAQDENDPTTANTTAGFSVSGAFRLADDFAVPAGGLDLAFVKIPAYTTGATSITATGATLQIWDGPPGDPSSTVIFGDTTTNRMAHVEWADIYRVFNTVTPPTCGGAPTAPGTTRRQQWIYIAVNQNLGEGTYWLDWNVTGSSFAPSTTSSDAIGRQCDPNNSNGLQFNATWVPANDAGQGCAPTPVQQDHYFEILGDAGGACYANCDGSTVEPILNVDDFTCFINEFAAAQALPPSQQVNAYANCDGSTVEPILNVDDFTCFINEFAAGCN